MKNNDKLDGAWPVVDRNIWVHNQLSNKAVHVIIVPNEDYVLAEMTGERE